MIVYFFIAFFLSRFVIPHLSFSPSSLPKDISEDMEKIIQNLSQQSGSKMDFLQKAFDYLGDRYHSERLATILKFSYLFKSLNDVWSRSGFIPCTQSNFLLQIFLVKSGWFKEEDIKVKHTFVNFVPHQYLQVKIDNNWLDVDVGEKYRGLPIGKHLKYFG